MDPFFLPPLPQLLLGSPCFATVHHATPGCAVRPADNREADSSEFQSGYITSSLCLPAFQLYLTSFLPLLPVALSEFSSSIAPQASHVPAKFFGREMGKGGRGRRSGGEKFPSSLFFSYFSSWIHSSPIPPILTPLYPTQRLITRELPFRHHGVQEDTACHAAQAGALGSSTCHSTSCLQQYPSGKAIAVFPILICTVVLVENVFQTSSSSCEQEPLTFFIFS